MLVAAEGMTVLGEIQSSFSSTLTLLEGGGDTPSSPAKRSRFNSISRRIST